MKPPRKPAPKTDIAIIGLGNWGTSLAAALTRARIPLSEVIVRRRKPSSSLPTVSWKNAALDARILWLCVPDSAISDVAAQIARHRAGLGGEGLRGQIVSPLQRSAHRRRTRCRPPRP